jgi:D-alanine-D-alanine ligase
MSDSRIKVAVVFGGKSTEHDVSVTSAGHILANIDMEKYFVEPFYVKKDGTFADHQELTLCLENLLNEHRDKIFPAMKEGEIELKKWIAKGTSSDFLGGIAGKKFDIVFPVFHGLNGEDGTIQGMLEFIGVPYVGCGVSASAFCIDKEATKVICQVNDIPVMNYTVVKKYEWENSAEKIINDIQEKINYPLYVKPARLGSSIGISRAENAVELKTSLKDAFKYDCKVIVERGVESPRELTMGVMGVDEQVLLSAIGEFSRGSNLYFNFDSKYGKTGHKGLVPASLEENTQETIEKYSNLIFKKFELSGFARIDYFLCGEKVYLNEINTIPGFETDDTFMRIWKNKGVDMKTFIDKAIEYGFLSFQSKSTRLYEVELKTG